MAAVRLSRLAALLLALGIGTARADLTSPSVGDVTYERATSNSGTASRTVAAHFGDIIQAADFGAAFDGVNVSTGVNIASGSTSLVDNSFSFPDAIGTTKLFLIQGVGSGGGWWSSPGTVTGIHTVTLANPAPNASFQNLLTVATVATPGTGVSLYDEITLAGGTSAAPAKVIVATLAVSGATVASGGTGGTTGACTFSGTTGDVGADATFTGTGTVSGGALTGALVIATGGNYLTPPLNPSVEPIAGCGLSNATVSVTMGAGQVTIDPAAPGNYSVNPGTTGIAQASTTGSGTGTTFNVTWGTAQGMYYGTDNATPLQNAINICSSRVSNNAGGCTINVPNGVGLLSAGLLINKPYVGLQVSGSSPSFLLRNTIGTTAQSFPTKLLYAGNAAPGYLLSLNPLVSDVYEMSGNTVSGIEFDCNAQPGCGGLLVNSQHGGSLGFATSEAFGTRHTATASTAGGSQIIQLAAITPDIMVGEPIEAQGFVSGTYVASINTGANQITASSKAAGTGLPSGAGIYIGGAGARFDTESGLHINDTQTTHVVGYARNLAGFGPGFLLEGTSSGPEYGNTSGNDFVLLDCFITFADCIDENNADHNLFENIGDSPVGSYTGRTFTANGSLDANNGAGRYNLINILSGGAKFRGTDQGGFTQPSVYNRVLFGITSTAGYGVSTGTGADASEQQDIGPYATNLNGVSLAYGLGTNNGNRFSFSMGTNATTSGQYSYAFGNAVSAVGTSASATGLNATSYLTGESCQAYGGLASGYPAQHCTITMRAVASGASGDPFTLTTDELAPGSRNCLNGIFGATGKAVSVQVIASDITTPANQIAYSDPLGLLWMTSSAAGSTHYQASSLATANVTGSTTGYAVSVGANTSQGCISLQFSRPTSNTDTWYVAATLSFTEVRP